MINKTVLMGRLTKDPELKYTQGNNTAVCSFTLAVDRQFAKPGEKRETDFIMCQAWTKTAEFVNKWFQKGSMIAIVGRIQTRSWDGEDGKKHYATEVVVEEVSFTGGKNEQSGQSGEQEQQHTYNSGPNNELDEDNDGLPF